MLKFLIFIWLFLAYLNSDNTVNALNSLLEKIKNKIKSDQGKAFIKQYFEFKKFFKNISKKKKK